MVASNLDIRQEIYGIESFWKNLISFLQNSPNSASKKKRELILLPFKLFFYSPYRN